MNAEFRTPIRRLLSGIIVCAVALALVAVPRGAAADTAPPAGAAPSSKQSDEATKAQAEQDKYLAEMQKYANPGPMHALLDPLVGSWTTTTTMWTGPDSTVTQGTCQRAWIMGKRYLHSTYAGTFFGMPFEGMEILGYDMMKKMFVSAWVDNLGTTISVSEKGLPDASGKIITIFSMFDDPITGKKVPYKMVTTIVDQDHTNFAMVGTKDGKDLVEMKIAYTRAK